MQLLLVLSCLTFFLYVVSLPFAQLMGLHQAEAAWRLGHVAQARALLEPVQRTWPQLYPQRTSHLCAELTLAQARHLLDEAAYGPAAGLAAALSRDCEAPERDGEAAQFVDHVATKHLAVALASCGAQDFGSALTTFQHIETLPYGEAFLLQARAEAAWCRLAFAQVLKTQAFFEAALEQLRRVISTQEGGLRAAAVAQMRPVVEEEIHTWLERQQYLQAFKTLGQRQASWGEYPETVDFFTRLSHAIDAQVLGLDLSRQCAVQAPRPGVPSTPKAGKKAVPSTPPPQMPGVFLVDPMLEATLPGTASPASNLLLRNETGHGLQVVLRSPEHRTEVFLAAQATQGLELIPGEYAVGIFAPGNCAVQPQRGTWTIRASGPPTGVRFAELALLR